MREGPFERDDKRALPLLSQRLTETATLSKAVRRAVLSGITNAVSLIKQQTIMLDRMGFVLEANAAAEQVLDDEVRICARRLVVSDQAAKSALNTFVDQLRTSPDTEALPVAPIVNKRRTKRPLLVRVLPVDGPARSPFLGTRAVLIFSDLENKSGARPEVLAQTFGVSRAEARLACLMATGVSPQRAAEELGIAWRTARTQLKAVFAKTNTHRQRELVALLSRL
jgi:DNA-binding CsgD family transcriptional regulator